ncbi:hypothetical protein EDB89DRAFT_1276081 [Lactarius sanguifluus]|nr:hypothetical protein EDB89DRAFT_755336 [Lactarius sanguifluus]KAH9170610.1 hypothetical protein EDB89DRAFT_1276081 [Lactarius sanguifluus]
MDSSQADPREYQRQVIDVEIKSLEESIRALRHRHNALAPVSSLPSKVIATIFSFLRLPGEPPLGGKSDHHLTWLSIAHVCHQWREIVLDLPHFWSHIDFTTVNMAGATEMLTRAGMVPLYLEAKVPATSRWTEVQFSTFLKELQAHVSHICHLGFGVNSYSPFHLQEVLEGLVSPAPALEYLSLSGEKYLCAITSGKPSLLDTLFDGFTPRLSRLDLRDCDISWRSPLLRGLKHLNVRTPSEDARLSLSAWLDALDEMPQLETLGLHSASPINSAFPFEVRRTATLSSLTHFNISAFPEECGLALAHLILPALISLCIKARSRREDGSDVEKLLPYVARHAHGPQDTQPLQSMVVCNNIVSAEILAWPVPNVNVEVHDPPTLLAATLPPRVTLCIASKVWPKIHLEILSAVMAALPLDSLVMLSAQHLHESYTRHLDEWFWYRHLRKWPLLRRARLAPPAIWGFIEILLEAHWLRKSPLLPSLTELVIVDTPLYNGSGLCDALMMRVEEGVPLETLDLRACQDDNPTEVQLLNEIVVNVLGPVKTFEERHRRRLIRYKRRRLRQKRLRYRW